MANAPQGWRSCRGTKAHWKLCEVEALAARLVEVLPEEARGLLRDPRWKGGNIVVIKDQVAWAPKQDDIIKNYVFIKEVVVRYGDRIPSSFFLADVFAEADKRLADRLLLPRSSSETKSSLALQEGGQLKKLCQYLRYLYRESPNSRHELIHELKGFLKPRGALLLDDTCSPTMTSSDDMVAEGDSLASLGSGDLVMEERALHVLELVLGPTSSWDNDVWSAAADLLDQVPFEDRPTCYQLQQKPTC